MIWLALIAGFLSGIAGAMGLGGGAVLIIYLSLFTDSSQMKAQGINLLFFIPIAITAVIIYAIKKQIKWKIVIKVSLWGIVGTFLGISLAGFIGGSITRKIFGALLIIVGIMEIIKKKR